MKKKAVFLDRDGTINIDKGFLYRKEDVEFIDGVIDFIRLLNNDGIIVVVVTNQSGVARGYYSEDDVQKLHTYINNELHKVNAHIDRFYYCPHHPEAPVHQYRIDCACRKPKPGMIHQAMEDLNIDPRSSFMIGDMARDICAGKKAGLTSILICEDEGAVDMTSHDEEPDLVVKSLHEAYQYILNRC